MNQDTMNRVQRCQLDILKQIDQLCEKHGLTYFAVGGTALGAVRHEGFIPWDDDIDIAMPREDYDRFIKAAEKELGGEYFLQHYHNEPRTPFYYIKVRKNGTKFVEYVLRDHPIHQGVFVDIFPYDALPDTPWKRKCHYYCSRLFYWLFSVKEIKTVKNPDLEKQGVHKARYKIFGRYLIHGLLKLVPKSWIFLGMDRCLKWYNGKNTMCIGYPTSKWLNMKKTDIYPVRRLPFENMMIPLPIHYDEYLQRKYGAYWELPPMTKRYGHRPYCIEFETED